MTGLLQNLARLGRGEPIAGAARVALPPRFAAPARTDGVPMPEAWPDKGQARASWQPALPATMSRDDPVTEPQALRQMEAESDDTESTPRPAVKPAVAARPIQSNVTPPKSPADFVLPVAPRDPPPIRYRREEAAHDALRPRDEAVTPPAPPLGQAALASQVQRRREMPPVIKVTIDRIDIRSPEPPRTARAVKPVPKPSVSLSDYLRRPGPGGRA